MMGGSMGNTRCTFVGWSLGLTVVVSSPTKEMEKSSFSRKADARFPSQMLPKADYLIYDWEATTSCFGDANSFRMFSIRCQHPWSSQ